MAQATLSCRCAAIHLETPLLGYLRAKCRLTAVALRIAPAGAVFRNYLPSRRVGLAILLTVCLYFVDNLL